MLNKLEYNTNGTKIDIDKDVIYENTYTHTKRNCSFYSSQRKVLPLFSKTKNYEKYSKDKKKVQGN